MEEASTTHVRLSSSVSCVERMDSPLRVRPEDLRLDSDDDDDDDEVLLSTSAPLSRSPARPIAPRGQNQPLRTRSRHQGSFMERLCQESVSPWITCVCVVNFDLEVGQTLERSFPPDKIPPEDEATVCFMSFPDSNTTQLGDTVYLFRYRLAQTGATGPLCDGSFLYGFVFFRQKKEQSIARGYFQKSVVVITPFPFIRLFRQVVSLLGPLYFKYGSPILEAACHNIAQWPPPHPGRSMELPFVGTVLQTSIPHMQDHPNLSDLTTATHAGSSESGIHRSVSLTDVMDSVQTAREGQFQDANIFTCFRVLVHSLWFLWQLVITGQPILVLSPTPTRCSEAVLALCSLISPIPFRGDFRPYFTIHDPDFREYSNRGIDEHSCVILGVTNPFFLKAYSEWPNLVALGNVASRSSDEEAVAPSTSARVAEMSEAYKARVYSTASVLVLPNKTVLNQLVAEGAETEGVKQINNELLRKHFHQLTEAFLLPFQSHFAVPSIPSHVSPFGKLPAHTAFDEATFLQKIEQGPLPSMAIVKSKRKWVELYRTFLRSPHFIPWFLKRRDTAHKELERRYRQAQFAANIPLLVHGLRGHQILELFGQIRSILDAETSSKNPDSKMCLRLKEHLAQLVPHLPEARLRKVSSSDQQVILSTLSQALHL